MKKKEEEGGKKKIEELSAEMASEWRGETRDAVKRIHCHSLLSFISVVNERLTQLPLEGNTALLNLSGVARSDARIGGCKEWPSAVMP